MLQSIIGENITISKRLTILYQSTFINGSNDLLQRESVIKTSKNKKLHRMVDNVDDITCQPYKKIHSTVYLQIFVRHRIMYARIVFFFFFLHKDLNCAVRSRSVVK